MRVEDYVKTLTPKQVVELMIDAVENPVVTLDFDTFGTFDGYNCTACAATNMAMKLCKIKASDDSVKTDLFESIFGRSNLFKIEYHFLDHFESAINHLRCARIDGYNNYAKLLEMAILPPLNSDTYYRLDNEDYMDNLPHWKEYAKTLS